MTRHLRVLQIEDSADDAELLRVELEMGGFSVDALRVETAIELASALQAGSWDVILSDYNLPSFSAEAALEEIKSRQIDLPFIVVSGYVGEEAAVALMRAGAHDFIVKGNIFRLVPVVERELREVRERRERRLVQQKLGENEKLMRGIASALGEGVLVLDREGRLVFMNPEAERLLGWSEFEFAGRDVHDTIHYLHSDGSPYPKEDCPVVDVLSRDSSYRSEDDVFVRKCGNIFPVSYVVTPLMDEGELMAAVMAFHDITERKAAENELRESRRQLRELSMFLQSVREEERIRIARDLHDDLGQMLTALKIDLDWLISRCPCNRAAKVKVPEKLAAMSSLVGKTVDSVRRIAQDLRPNVLDDLGLAAAIEWQVEQFQERTGIFCKLAMNREEYQLQDQVAISMFRIVQEAFTNVARHAGASQVTVTVDEDAHGISLRVKDNGTGFDMEKKRDSKSHGLLGIRERVIMFGGEIEIFSGVGQGTEIRVWIPSEVARGEHDTNIDC